MVGGSVTTPSRQPRLGSQLHHRIVLQSSMSSQQAISLLHAFAGSHSPALLLLQASPETMGKGLG